MFEARQPFEPDPGRTGVGTGTPRQKPPSSSQMPPDLRATGVTEIDDAGFRSTLIRQARTPDRGAARDDRAFPVVAQDRGDRPAAPGNLGPNARDRPGGLVGRAADPRLRHFRPLFRPGGRD